jgi:hypothetical protein
VRLSEEQLDAPSLRIQPVSRLLNLLSYRGDLRLRRSFGRVERQSQAS